MLARSLALFLTLLLSANTALAQDTVQLQQSRPVLSEQKLQGSDTRLLLMGNSAVGVSCSSKDGTQDCFCPGGCRRTQSSCSCTGSSIMDLTFDGGSTATRN